MTTFRTSTSRRPARIRGALIALFTGAGVMLSPVAAQAGGSGTPASVVASSGAAQTAVNTALAQRGDRYVWGGAGPHVFDCSGLIQFAYRKAGIQLPHSSKAQSRMGTPVSRANLKPGDLIFFYSPVSHVAMYIGNGQMVHALRPGSVVSVVNVSWMPGYHSARRLA